MKFIKGDSPILIVCPHGNPNDDFNTDIISEIVADKVDAYAVINKTWRRGDKVDIANKVANFNRIDHAEDSKFLEKIKDYRDNILDVYRQAHVFFIHGMVDFADKGKAVDCVLGFGNGNPQRLTCSFGFKNELAYRFSLEKWQVRQGGPGSRYAAWDINNMCQYFRENNLPSTNAIQIEISRSLRDPETQAKKTALSLSNVIFNFIYKNNTVPKQFHLLEIQ